MARKQRQRLRMPVESEGYRAKSRAAVNAAQKILESAIAAKRNTVQLWTDLSGGLPMENVNKIAGPVMEAWACERYREIFEDSENEYRLCFIRDDLPRLHMADVILGFNCSEDRPNGNTIAEIDVKSTSLDIEDSGKSPNITSFAKIRNAYMENPDYIFLICSIKHRVLKADEATSIEGAWDLYQDEMVAMDCKLYDLKYLSKTDLSYNPALGTGQIQVKDIHDVGEKIRTVAEFIEIIDRKFIASKKGQIEWDKLAHKNGWYEVETD